MQDLCEIVSVFPSSLYWVHRQRVSLVAELNSHLLIKGVFILSRPLSSEHCHVRGKTRSQASIILSLNISHYVQYVVKEIQLTHYWSNSRCKWYYKTYNPSLGRKLFTNVRKKYAKTFHHPSLDKHQCWRSEKDEPRSAAIFVRHDDIEQFKFQIHVYNMYTCVELNLCF